MNFQSFGQTAKGHSRDHDGKSKGKTEQAQKVRAKPMGRNQLGVKMQLSLQTNKRMATSASLYEGPIFFFTFMYLLMQESKFFSLLLFIFLLWQASCGEERSRHIYPVECG